MVNKAVENAVEKSVVKQVTAVVRAEVANAVNIAVKAVLRDRESNQKMSNHVDSDFSGNEGSSKNVAGGSVRYLPVTQQEVDSVKSAIYGVTWRSCHKGHLFAVGDCGQPAERGTCLECKISVGR
ncbi:hypothetical protein J3B02_000107 [Coemansia erecta]|nr:hypothetical protein J3B02_000107 [Coemansia erecta]